MQVRGMRRVKVIRLPGNPGSAPTVSHSHAYSPVSDRGIILHLKLDKVSSTVLDLLGISAALGGQELLLRVAQIPHDGITGPGHSGILLQRIAARNARLQAAQGHEAVHCADVHAVGLAVSEDLADRVALAGLCPPASLFQGGALGGCEFSFHRFDSFFGIQATPLSIELSTLNQRSHAISRATAGEVRGPSRLSMNWMRSRTAQRSGVLSPGSLARCRQDMRRRRGGNAGCSSCGLRQFLSFHPLFCLSHDADGAVALCS